ncbi:FAD-dependent oxidoreductase [Streptomyces asiaticus]
MGTTDRGLRADLLVIGFGKGGKTAAATMGGLGKRVVLVAATGRAPATRDLGLDAAGVRTTERGAVAVEEHLRSSRPHIFALGDVNGGPRPAELRNAVYTHPTSTEAFNDVLATIVRADT